MLLFPFCSALILARAWSWRALPAMVAVVGVFVLKEPLLVLARQAWTWREPHPEAAAARRSLLVYGALTLSASVWLCLAIRPLVLLGLGAAAMALTGLPDYLALENRPRAMLLQLGSALGLSGSALLAWLALRPTLAPAVWWLWAAHASHSTATLLVVRARLAALAGLRSGGTPPALRVAAWLAQAVLLVAAAVAAGCGQLALAAPLLFGGRPPARLGSAAEPGIPAGPAAPCRPARGGRFGAVLGSGPGRSLVAWTGGSSSGKNPKAGANPPKQVQIAVV